VRCEDMSKVVVVAPAVNSKVHNYLFHSFWARDPISLKGGRVV